MPDNQPRSSLAAPLALAAILLMLVGGYFLFPTLLRAVSYQDCIASGRVTGC